MHRQQKNIQRLSIEVGAIELLLSICLELSLEPFVFEGAVEVPGAESQYFRRNLELEDAFSG